MTNNGSESGRYSLRVVGTGPQEVGEYGGVVEQRDIPRLRLVSDNGASGIVVGFNQRGELVGQRIVANSDCFLTYSIVARRTE